MGSLLFYSVPLEKAANQPSDKNLLGNFIEENGKRVEGEVEFAAGMSGLFFQAAANLVGIDALNQLREPELGHGYLSKKEAQEAIVGLKAKLDPANEASKQEISALVTEFDLDPEQFQEDLKTLIELLEGCLENGGEPFTSYHE